LNTKGKEQQYAKEETMQITEHTKWKGKHIK
jgi:hypothetical protein